VGFAHRLQLKLQYVVDIAHPTNLIENETFEKRLTKEIKSE